LEQGVAPWKKPWRCEMPCNLISGKEYRGINPFLLASQGYGSRYWLTFNQANKLGGHVRKGEKSSIVTFWKIDEFSKENKETGKTEDRKSILLRYFAVFNVEQTEGIADKLGLGNAGPRVPNIEACESIVSGMPNAPAMQQSNAAWYRPLTDTVGMPNRDTFHSSEEFYSTLFHELAHSTGHRSRVGRDNFESPVQFGSESYSKEELVAECAAAMLCGVTGIDTQTLDNSAAYLQSWITRLKADSKLIVQAASAAQKAADYIRNTDAKCAETIAETDLAIAA